MPRKPLPPPDIALTGLQAPHGEGLLVAQDWHDWFRTLESGSDVVINVVTLGADANGVNDSAPAFRSALGSDRIIFVPPGTYLFKSGNPPIFPPNPAANTLVDIDSFDNWTIIGHGATINVDPSVMTNGGWVFNISRCNNWQVYGLTINQTPPGAGFNGGFGIISSTNFHISHITFGPGLDNQAFFGNFLIDGLIDNIDMVHGQFGDFSNITHMRFDNIRADGANDTGLFLGVAADIATPPLYNETGVVINQSQDISITRCNVSGYLAAVVLQEGLHYRFSDNYWHDLPGALPGTAPAAIIITYSVAVATSSSGIPVQGVIINGDVFASIGSTFPGYAIYIDASPIVNADLIKNIVIGNCLFDNISFCGIALVAGSEPHQDNLVLGAGNIFDDLGVMTLPASAEFIAEAELHMPWPP